MDIKEWDKLPQAEQDGLASTYGITRSGENNSIVKEEELTKIPVVEEVKKEVEPKKDVKKKTKRVIVKKAPKRSNK